ncbi:Uncharacterised protein [Mycobacteroides abscessus subsp. abscessus]|nr:Uncharacterised protein [Mycobacteroides abscessus subsp. abscessus]
MAIDATHTATMNAAAKGIGAAVTSRVRRPSGRSLLKCSQNAHSAVITNSAKKIVLSLIPPTATMSLLNGTP